MRIIQAASGHTRGYLRPNNKAFVPAKPLRKKSITEQIDAQLPKIISRYEATEFFAYFQAATNTYAPIDRLRELYDEALSHPNIIGLKISTRGILYAALFTWVLDFL